MHACVIGAVLTQLNRCTDGCASLTGGVCAQAESFAAAFATATSCNCDVLAYAEVEFWGEIWAEAAVNAYADTCAGAPSPASRVPCLPDPHQSVPPRGQPHPAVAAPTVAGRHRQPSTVAELCAAQGWKPVSCHAVLCCAVLCIKRQNPQPQ